MPKLVIQGKKQSKSVFGGATGKKRATQKSARQLDAQQFHNKVKLWFKELDDTYQDVLDRPRVEKLLHLLHEDHGEHSPPRTPEVDWVMRKASHTTGGVLTLPECEEAVTMYKSYLKRRGEIDAVFEKYDADGDDMLSREELAEYIKNELNFGDAPSDKEIDWLMGKCDVGGMTSHKGDGLIGRTEIMRAKDEWTLMPDTVGGGSARRRQMDDNFDDDFSSSRKTLSEPSGGCCVVS